MIQLITLLFLLCSPVAKYEVDTGKWDFNDADVEIALWENEENEVERVHWKAEQAICKVEVKAGTETSVVEYDEPVYAATAYPPNDKEISNIVWYAETGPTSVSLSSVSVSQDTPIRDAIDWIMGAVALGTVFGLFVWVVVEMFRDDREED